MGDAREGRSCTERDDKKRECTIMRASIEVVEIGKGLQRSHVGRVCGTA